jgi:23S rRNA (guanine745-N1)-methyltransferase
MLHSRRAFLDAGFYEPLLHEVIARAIAIAGLAAGPTRLLDVGCGEGYFTGGLARALSARSEIWGLDISRAAVDVAAKRHRESNFAVARARDLPIRDRAVDILICIFGPSQPAEYRRVLNSAGRAIVVGPGRDHLIELRSQLYWEVRPPGRGSSRSFGSEWRSAPRAELRYPMRLTRQDRRHLFAMTPYAWAGVAESRHALFGSATGEITAHFLIFELAPF